MLHCGARGVHPDAGAAQVRRLAGDAAVIVAQIALAKLGFEHNLYQYAGTPPVPLSDMNGQGAFRGVPRPGFALYWAAFARAARGARLRAVAPRRLSARCASRLRALPRRLRGAPAVIARRGADASSRAGRLHLLQHQRPERVPHPARRRAAWRRTTRRRCSDSRPCRSRASSTSKLDVDLYPRRAARRDAPGATCSRTARRAAWRGPRAGGPRDTDPAAARACRGAAMLRQEFAGFNYRIYTLEPPLAARRAREDALRDRARAARLPQRAQRDATSSTTARSSTTSQIAPVLGMGRDVLLQDRAKRRKYGLPAELRPPKLEDDSAPRQSLFPPRQRLGRRRHHGLDRRRSAGDRPGLQVSENRRERPPHRRAIKTERADPALLLDPVGRATRSKRDRWNDVDLAVYYHPAHAYNVERMIDAMKASLDYFTDELQPVPVPAAPHPRVPGVRELRAGLRRHDPVLGRHRLHRRATTIPRRSTSSPT